jgi:hypothetical protein
MNENETKWYRATFMYHEVSEDEKKKKIYELWMTVLLDIVETQKTGKTAFTIESGWTQDNLHNHFTVLLTIISVNKAHYVELEAPSISYSVKQVDPCQCLFCRVKRAFKKKSGKFA